MAPQRIGRTNASTIASEDQPGRDDSVISLRDNQHSIGDGLYQPQTCTIALCFMILSMLCGGSWANSVKLCPGYRFQLFYWDYVVVLVAGVLLWGLTLGTAGATGRSFAADLAATDAAHIGFALVGGVLFNV